jgi:hypothetical protein
VTVERTDEFVRIDDHEQRATLLVDHAERRLQCVRKRGQVATFQPSYRVAAIASTSRNLAEQRALADAGRPADMDDAAGVGAGEDRFEHTEFRPAPHECCAVPLFYSLTQTRHRA